MNAFKMPALFIGHGSPMNAIQDNTYTRNLAKLGRTIPKPESILVISAHWLTRGTLVTAQEDPQQIYDFYGFPEQLHRVKYPATGSPALAARICALSPDIGGSADWGLDHASWAVLVHMFPNADIPVVELSLDLKMPCRRHYALGRALAPLREEGVLVLGSGNIVHNLHSMDWEHPDAEPVGWAAHFDDEVRLHLLDRDHEGLMDYRHMSGAANAVPTPDHYLPMLYVLGMQGEDESLAFTHEGFQHASISMRCFRIG